MVFQVEIIVEISSFNLAASWDKRQINAPIR
jgi:hypothetical protein